MAVKSITHSYNALLLPAKIEGNEHESSYYTCESKTKHVTYIISGHALPRRRAA